MIKGKTRRYSGLISPLSYFIDIAIIIVVTQQFLAIYLYKEFEFKHLFTLTVLWIIVSVFNRFYYIYRYTNFLKIINLLFNQIVLFALSLFCFAGIFPGVANWAHAGGLITGSTWGYISAVRWNRGS